MPHTELAQATCGTIPLKLLKLGAHVTVSVRLVAIAMASPPRQFAPAHAQLARPAP